MCMLANEVKRGCDVGGGGGSNCVCGTVEQIYSVPDIPIGGLHKPAMKINIFMMIRYQKNGDSRK